MVDKKRLIISYKNITPEIISAIREQYPEGYVNYIKKIDTGPSSFFHAITVETEDAIYMVKIDVKIDKKDALEKDEEMITDTVMDEAADEIAKDDDGDKAADTPADEEEKDE
jgi:hypothetical protein